MDKLLAEALGVFQTAAQRVQSRYMNLKRANQNSAHLERVYCYELYHQFRMVYSDDRYSFCGEVDKSGHSDFTGPNLKNKKPDFLLHIPGSHQGNLIVFEVKMADGLIKRDFTKDCRTLTAFRTHAGNFLAYQAAVFLLVGGTYNRHVKKVRNWIETMDDQDANTDLIMFYWHESPGIAPKLIFQNTIHDVM